MVIHCILTGLLVYYIALWLWYRYTDRRTSPEMCIRDRAHAHSPPGIIVTVHVPGYFLVLIIGFVILVTGCFFRFGYLSLIHISDTSKTAASWFGACIFLIVAATILRSFFL